MYIQYNICTSNSYVSCDCNVSVTCKCVTWIRVICRDANMRDLFNKFGLLSADLLIDPAKAYGFSLYAEYTVLEYMLSM